MSKIKLVNKIIDIDNSRIIYNTPLDDSWQDDWQVMAGEWSVQDGCLVGVERGNKGGVLFFKQRFDGINLREQRLHEVEDPFVVMAQHSLM